VIKDFEPRIYQQTILATAATKNTLVVLPTGLGKTYLFLMLAAQRLKQFPGSKIMLLGPTKPLITQYRDLFLRHFEILPEQMEIFTGDIKPSVREERWKAASAIFSTPQGLENDIVSGKIDLSDVSLLGFDEAHRATGEYSYVWIAEQYIKKARNPRIIALTASPGSDTEKIMEVCTNLHIEDVEIRTDEDPDVKPYLQSVNVKWIYVELPDYFRSVQKYLKDCHKSKIDSIKSLLNIVKPLDTKTELLALQHDLLARMKDFRDIDSMKGISLVAEAMKVEHAVELLESQGITPLSDYMEDMVVQSASTKTKAVINLVSDLNFKSALVLVRNLKSSKLEHPKYDELKKILLNYQGNFKAIVFSQYRDSISSLVKAINNIGIKAEMFVGQAKKKDTGMSQKAQIDMLERFKTNDVNVLVMSSVGEEGLDIPSVDCVIFYEPVPSAIRTIQRRGRTGRQSSGEVFVLVAKNTRDEAYRWTAFHKEKRMTQILLQLKGRFSARKRIEKPLTEFILPDSGLTIHADHREKSTGVIKKLHELGISIRLDQLEVGDYLLGNNVCVEYKTIPDFIDSMIDKRLFTQLKAMQKYRRPIILIEGTEDIFSQRMLHPNAIRGMLAAIVIDYSVPILYTRDAEESALMMAVIAKREQENEKSDFTLHSQKPLTLKEQQEYLVSSLPGVGPVLSKPLLRKFGSVKKIINSTEDELRQVDLIGEKKAAKIKEIVESEYQD
jgi:ERCC4-related helicase